MPINPSIAAPGLAEYESDTIGAVVELFAGDTPAPVTTTATYDTALATSGIPAYTPVSVDVDTGAIALVDGSTVPKANAVTVGVLRAGAGGGVAGRVAVYRAGTFNINALNWPDALSSEALRLAAFDLAACQIYVKKPYYA